MAGGWSYCCFLPLTLALTFTSAFSLDQSTIDGDFKNRTSAKITLKKCCWNNHEQNHYDHECSKTINVTWDVLKVYGVLKIEVKNDSALLTKFEHKSLLQDPLRCNGKYENKHMLRYSIPVWKELEKHAIKTSKSFSYFTQDGHLQYNEYAFSPEEYCVESVIPEVITVVTCDYASYCSKDTSNRNEKDSRPCLFRCCNYGEVWDMSSSPISCKDSGIHKWKLPSYLNLNSKEIFTADVHAGKLEPVVLSLHPRNIMKNCKTDYTFQASNQKLHQDANFTKLVGKLPFKVLENGTVWMKIRKREWVQLNPGEYCVDGFQIGEGNYSGDYLDSILFECKVFETPQEVQGQERQRQYSLSFGIIISVCLLFLLMTTIVYMLLWSKHNIHGWTVFSYITTLLITYFLLGASHFTSVISVREHTEGKLDLLTFCGLLGVLCHFFFLCTFSWSTVLSFDLFCTFRTLKPTRNLKSSGLKKFLLYCLFAFIVPAFIVTVGILLDITYSTDVVSDVITPEYGKSVCYVGPRYGRFYFVILPIAVFLGINFALFCNTAYSVYKVKKSTQFASSSSTKKEEDNQTVKLILKLLLVNGMVWVVEIVSWYLQKDHDKVGVLSFILDVVNVMQAVAIFFLFVFKNDILESLKRMYPILESTINVAFKLKTFGRSQRPESERRANVVVVTTSTNASYKVKVDENLPVASL